MAAAQNGLASATARRTRLRLVLTGHTLAPSVWPMAHAVVGVTVVAHLPAMLSYLDASTDPPGIWVAIALISALASLPTVLTRRTRSILAGISLGMLPVITMALPHKDALSAVELVAVLLVAGLYRDWLPWALTVGSATTIVMVGTLQDPLRTFGAGHTHPYETPSSIFSHFLVFVLAAVIAAVAHIAIELVRAQERQARQALTVTRNLLGAVTDVVGAASTMLEAAEGVVDALADDLWPVGHLLVRDGDSFVSAGCWSARARRDYPELVADLTFRLPATGRGTSALARAMSSGLPRSEESVEGSNGPLREPVWLSERAGTPALGTLSAAVSPERAAALAKAGMHTMIMCPVVVGGRTVALLELLSVLPLTAAPDEMGTVRLVARLLARAAERDEAAEQLAERHAMLRAIERTVPDTIVAYDVESGEVLDYSPGTRILRQPEDVVGRDIEEVFATSPLSWGTDDISSFTAELSPTVPLIAVLPDPSGAGAGAPHEVYRSVETVGRRKVAFVYVRDVSDRERIARDLDEASSRAQALLGVAESGIYDLDAEGRVVYTNPEGARLLCADADAVTGARFADLVPFLADDLTGDNLTGNVTGEVVDGEGAGASGTVVVRRSGRLTDHCGGQVPVSAAITWRGQRPGPRRAIVTLTDVSHAEQSALLAQRHTHALEINDTVVQGVATALYAIETDEIDTAVLALEATLSRAKATIATLLADAPLTPALLRRTEAAHVLPVADPELVAPPAHRPPPGRS